MFRAYHFCLAKYSNFQPFSVALLNGYVYGGGSGYSIYSPIKVATEKTMYAMPECIIGYITDAGATYYLSRKF